MRYGKVNLTEHAYSVEDEPYNGGGYYEQYLAWDGTEERVFTLNLKPHGQLKLCEGLILPQGYFDGVEHESESFDIMQDGMPGTRE